jgi:mono/diheme cytochrome c family protein
MMAIVSEQSVISRFLMLAVIAGCLLSLNSAAAQSRHMGPQRGQGDMWNPQWMQRDMWGPGPMGPGMRRRMARHWTYMHQGLPPEYHVALNPLSPDTKTISQGRTLYQKNCASCHGKTGMGDSEPRRSLSPSPALLAYMIQSPNAVDGYMLWSISDGGGAFGSAMPAFKKSLTQDQIWKIVTYMRAGFPTGQAQ